MRKLLMLSVLLTLLLAGCYQEGNYLIVRTADPNISVALPIFNVPTPPITEPEVVPETEVGEAEPEPEPEPPCDVIKGNVSTSTGEKIYHVPGQANYDRVLIDGDRGERWFCSEEAAQAAGWRKARN